MALALAEPKRVRKPLPFPRPAPIPFPRPKPQSLPPAAASEDVDPDVLAGIEQYFQPPPVDDPDTLGIPGAFRAYWAELRRYGTHYLDLYGHVDDAYADGEDIAASAFLALVERATDWQTASHYVESAQPAPARLLRNALYDLAKVELRRNTSEGQKRHTRVGGTDVRVSTVRISDLYREGAAGIVDPAAPPLRLPDESTPVEAGEVAGVEALAPGSVSRTVLAVLARECPLAARVLTLRYVQEWSEREVADACALSLRALDGHLRQARKRFAALYRRLS